MSKENVPDHERLFDEICGKLNELSGQRNESPADRFERLQQQLKKSQEEWKSAQSMMQERMQNFEQFSNSQNEMTQEIRRLSDLLESERASNSKISADLAKALELNLKLQFDIEEIRTKASQLVAEERKHNQFLVEKNRTLTTEMELSQAMNQEIRLELGKAREKFLQDQNQWTEDKTRLENELKSKNEEIEATLFKVDETEEIVRRQNEELQSRVEEASRLTEEITGLNETLHSFEEHARQQSEAMRQLTSTAEKKLVEMKLALDKKIIESNDYYGHLQQALTQVQILRQENAALKEYMQKLSQLHQSGQLNMNSSSTVKPSVMASASVADSGAPAAAPAPAPTPAPVALLN